MDNLTIGLIGCISSGKSSFVNALSCGFISNTSVQRETFNATSYVYKKNQKSREYLDNLTTRMKEIHENNQNKRENIKDIDEEKICCMIHANDDETALPSYLEIDYTLIDFPGLDDSEDNTGKFIEVFKTHFNKCHVIIYLTSVDKAFTSNSEVSIFKQIKDIIDKENETGDYIKLIVAVNKFDDLSNSDYNDIYNRIPNTINIDKKDIFKLSTHKLMVQHLDSYKIKAFKVPKFIKSEFKSMLKNNRIIITHDLKKKFKKKSYISYEDLKCDDNEELSLSDSSDEEENKVSKDNFKQNENIKIMEWLFEFQQSYDSKKFEYICKKLEDIKKWMQHNNADCSDKKFQQKTDISVKLLKSYFNDEFYNDNDVCIGEITIEECKIINLIFNLSNKNDLSSVSVKYWRFSLLHTSLEISRDFKISVIPYVKKNLLKGHWLNFIYIANQHIREYINWFSDILSMRDIWIEYENVKYYSPDDRIVYTGFEGITNIKDIKFINSNKMNTAIKLLDVPLNNLRYLLAHNKKIYELFEDLKFPKYVISNIKYYLEYFNEKDPIRHKAFELKSILDDFKDI